MFGKHFASMYSGSMVGRGALVFAVMGYVISNMKPDAEVGMQVELNTVLLSAILGEQEGDVRAAIEFLCSPDAESRSKEEEGRRLKRVGQFSYQVVNGAKYRAMRTAEDVREYNRLQKQVSRARKKRAARLPGQVGQTQAGRVADKLEANGQHEEAERLRQTEAVLNQREENNEND